MKRTFTVFTEAHVADPAHLCPVIETTGYRQVMYSSTLELRELLDEMDQTRMFNEGRAFAENTMYAALGIKTPMEFEELVKKIKNIS